MDSSPRAGRMNGTQLRYTLDALVAVADRIDAEDLVLVLVPASDIVSPEDAPPPAETDPYAFTETFLRAVATLEAYRDICEAPDAPRTHEIDRFLAAKSAGEATRIDSVKIARFARRLTSGLAEAAATALDEPDQGAVA
jgi:hypothetical protein